MRYDKVLKIWVFVLLIVSMIPVDLYVVADDPLEDIIVGGVEVSRLDPDMVGVYHTIKDNGDGSKTGVFGSAPLNYPLDNGSWSPIDTSFELLGSNHYAHPFGYRAGNEKGLFSVFFKQSLTSDYPVAFVYNKSDDGSKDVLQSKLSGIAYLDSQDWNYTVLQNVLGATGSLDMGDPSVITYEDAFSGVDVNWTYTPSGLKEDIICSQSVKDWILSHPPSDYGYDNQSTYFTFYTKLKFSNIRVLNNSVNVTGVNVTSEHLVFTDYLNETLFSFPVDYVYELNNPDNKSQVKYRLVYVNNETFLWEHYGC